MSNTDLSSNIETIKSDIKTLINDLSKLKGGSESVLSESLKQLTETVSNITDKGKSQLQGNHFIIKALTWIYGDTMKKAAISLGVAALVTYLVNKDNS